MEIDSYVLVNKKTGDALFERDKYYNTRMIVRSHSELINMLSSDKNLRENYIIISEKDYFLSRKKMLENNEYMEAMDKLCDEISDILHNELPEDLKKEIELDYEKKIEMSMDFPQ